MRYWLGCLVVFVFLLLSTPVASAQADTGVDVGVVDSSTGRWYLLHEHPEGGDGVTSFYFGNPGDVPFMGDWDCDGVDTPGLYRQSDGYVYLRNSNTEGIADVSFFFGDPGDIPIAGDFDGDGCDSVAVYRPSEGRTYIINELGEDGGGLGAADYAYYYGNPLDTPFVGDFDNDGVDTLGLHRESTGQVFLRNSNSQGTADLSFYYGNPGDLIMAGSWRVNQSRAGDTVGIYRPRDRTIYLRFSNSPGPADWMSLFGNPLTRPVAGEFGDLPGNDDPPDLQAELNAQFFQTASEQCGVHLNWNWDGPIWVRVSLSYMGGHQGPIEEFSQLIDPDGTLDSYTYTFNYQIETGKRVGAAIFAGDSDPDRFIDGAGGVINPDCTIRVTL